MENENKVENLNENEIEKVTGGANAPRDKKTEEIISKIKLPKYLLETHEVTCDYCHQPMTVCGGFSGIPICDDCRTGRTRRKMLEKLKQKIEKSKQIPTARETKN